MTEFLGGFVTYAMWPLIALLYVKLFFFELYRTERTKSHGELATVLELLRKLHTGATL